MKIITTSFTIIGKEPGYLELLKHFEGIKTEYFELDLIDQIDFNAWCVTVSYDCLQAKEFGQVIQDIIIDYLPVGEYVDLPF